MELFIKRQDWDLATDKDSDHDNELKVTFVALAEMPYIIEIGLFANTSGIFDKGICILRNDSRSLLLCLLLLLK